MKKIYLFVGICALMLGLMTSCKPDPVEPETLPAPAGLEIGTLTATSAELSWDAVAGAEKYKVVIDSEEPVEVTATSYTAQSLTAETDYTWKVQAVKGDVVSEWTAGPGFKTPKDNITDELPAPTNLAVGTVTTTTAELSWDAVTGAEKYNLSIDEGTPVEVTATSYVAEGLTAETDYTWKVQAVKGDTVSEWADGPSFNTPAEGLEPTTPPTNLMATSVTDNSAILSWEHPDSEAEETIHEVSINNGPAVEATGIGYQATGLTPATEYTWKVRTKTAGREWSVWVAGDNFTTEEASSGRVRFVSGEVTEYYGDTYYGAGTENYVFVFTEYDPAGNNQVGVNFRLDMCISGADLGVDSGKAYLDLPNVTYNYTTNSYNPGMNTIVTGYTALGFRKVDPVSGGITTTYSDITSGTMTVTGSHAGGYSIIFEIEHAGGTLSAEYNGPFVIANPYL